MKFEPGKVFQSTYWSSMSGKEDKSENYNLVTYSLSVIAKNQTLLTLIQENIPTEEEKEHSIRNWKLVLKKLKNIAETMV